MTTPTKDIKHRRAIKKFFITFPQSNGLPKSGFFEDVTTQYKASKAICVEEKHADGNPHLHLAIEFNDFVTKYQLLQHLQSIYIDSYKRIDVRSMISMNNSISYLTSPDKQKYVDPSPFLYNINLQENSTKKHELFKREFPKDNPLSWAPNCYCNECITLIKLHRYEPTWEERETFSYFFNNSLTN